MFGLLACIIAFTTTFIASKRSVGQGLGVLLAWGYAYGVIRANFLDTYTHFMFDAAVIGIYVARLRPRLIPRHLPGVATLTTWITCLVAWPIILLAMPGDHILVNLVGLRVAMFYLPLVLIGSQATYRDLDRVGVWLATLNLVALVASVLEMRYGIGFLYPRNAVTELIFATAVGEPSTHRIPATFSTAAAYGTCMFLAFPFVVGAALRARSSGRTIYLTIGVAAGVAGLLLCSCRLPVLAAGISAVLYVFFRGNRAINRRFVVVAAVIAGAFAFTVQTGGKRAERFLQLGDIDSLVQRVRHINDLYLIDCMVTYPLGNGLAGAGGITIPYFLQQYATNRTVPGAESEYFRIVLTQGIVGLALWFGFLCWFFSWPLSKAARYTHPAQFYFFSTAFASFLVASRSVGTLYGTPSICLLFAGMAASIRGIDASSEQRTAQLKQRTAKGVHNRVVDDGNARTAHLTRRVVKERTQ